MRSSLVSTGQRRVEAPPAAVELSADVAAVPREDELLRLNLELVVAVAVDEPRKKEGVAKEAAVELEKAEVEGWSWSLAEEEVVFWLEVDLVELILRPREGRRKNPEVLASSSLNMGSHRRTVEEGEGRKEGRGRFGVREGGFERAKSGDGGKKESG